MDELIEQASSVVEQTNATRRKVLASGARLAYAAPLVAATFKLSGSAAMALSPTCDPGTCAGPVKCAELCGCREVGGSTYCLQQMRCSDAKVCDPSVGCPEGYVCLVGSCCRDGLPRCVLACQADQGKFQSTMTSDDDLVLGPIY